MNGVYLLPVNLYGPRDNFDLHTSHVIPALIRKCVEAKRRGDKEIQAWGTGSASREFLYVEDCAEGVVRSMEKYDSPEPMNLGSGREITIKDLTQLVAKLSGFDGQDRLGSDQTRWPAAALPGREPGEEGARFCRGNVAGRRPRENDQVV